MIRLTELLNDIQDGEIELELNAVVTELYNEHAKVRNGSIYACRNYGARLYVHLSSHLFITYLHLVAPLSHFYYLQF